MKDVLQLEMFEISRDFITHIQLKKVHKCVGLSHNLYKGYTNAQFQNGKLTLAILKFV